MEATNEFSKIAGKKINIQKSVLFLYTIDKLSRNETKKTIAFTLAEKKKNNLGIRVTKEEQISISVNYKTLFKENKDLN